MKALTEQEREELNQLLKAGTPLPDYWRHRLFPGGNSSTIGKEYRLLYEGKLTREEVLAQTPAAPWQQFNPDFFLKVAGERVILVVEVKSHGDDSNRNKAKWRDGLRHFEMLNAKLKAAGTKWQYHFYFLSPENYTSFFEKVRKGEYPGWRSGLMQALSEE